MSIRKNITQIWSKKTKFSNLPDENQGISGLFSCSARQSSLSSKSSKPQTELTKTKDLARMPDIPSQEGGKVTHDIPSLWLRWAIISPAPSFPSISQAAFRPRLPAFLSAPGYPPFGSRLPSFPWSATLYFAPNLLKTPPTAEKPGIFPYRERR